MTKKDNTMKIIVTLLVVALAVAGIYYYVHQKQVAEQEAKDNLQRDTSNFNEGWKQVGDDGKEVIDAGGNFFTRLWDVIKSLVGQSTTDNPKSNSISSYFKNLGAALGQLVVGTLNIPVKIVEFGFSILSNGILGTVKTGINLIVRFFGGMGVYCVDPVLCDGNGKPIPGNGGDDNLPSCGGPAILNDCGSNYQMLFDQRNLARDAGYTCSLPGYISATSNYCYSCNSDVNLNYRTCIPTSVIIDE